MTLLFIFILKNAFNKNIQHAFFYNDFQRKDILNYNGSQSSTLLKKILESTTTNGHGC